MAQVSNADLVGEIDLGKLRRLVDIAVGVLVKEHNGEHGGGTFFLRADGEPSVAMDERFREPKPGKALKYDHLAHEKANRLSDHIDHILSRQSANEEKEQYPGAVRSMNSLIGSFSGFTADEDEALVLWVFLKMGWLNRAMVDYTVRLIKELSGSSRYSELEAEFDEAERLAA